MAIDRGLFVLVIEKDHGRSSFGSKPQSVDPRAHIDEFATGFEVGCDLQNLFFDLLERSFSAVDKGKSAV